MNFIRRRGWEIPDRFVTPEHLFFNRRQVLGAAAGAATLLAAGPSYAEDDPSAGFYPAKLNPKYAAARASLSSTALRLKTST